MSVRKVESRVTLFDMSLSSISVMSYERLRTTGWYLYLSLSTLSILCFSRCCRPFKKDWLCLSHTWSKKIPDPTSVIISVSKSFSRDVNRIVHSTSSFSAGQIIPWVVLLRGLVSVQFVSLPKNVSRISYWCPIPKIVVVLYWPWTVGFVCPCLSKNNFVWKDRQSRRSPLTGQSWNQLRESKGKEFQVEWLY